MEYLLIPGTLVSIYTPGSPTRCPHFSRSSASSFDSLYFTWSSQPSSVYPMIFFLMGFSFQICIIITSSLGVMKWPAHLNLLHFASANVYAAPNRCLIFSVLYGPTCVPFFCWSKYLSKDFIFITSLASHSYLICMPLLPAINSDFKVKDIVVQYLRPWVTRGSDYC